MTATLDQKPFPEENLPTEEAGEPSRKKKKNKTSSETLYKHGQRRKRLKFQRLIDSGKMLD